MRKSYPLLGFDAAAFELPVQCSTTLRGLELQTKFFRSKTLSSWLCDEQTNVSQVFHRQESSWRPAAGQYL